MDGMRKLLAKGGSFSLEKNARQGLLPDELTATKIVRLLGKSSGYSEEEWSTVIKNAIDDRTLLIHEPKTFNHVFTVHDLIFVELEDTSGSQPIINKNDFEKWLDENNLIIPIKCPLSAWISQSKRATESSKAGADLVAHKHNKNEIIKENIRKHAILMIERGNLKHNVIAKLIMDNGINDRLSKDTVLSIVRSECASLGQNHLIIGKKNEK